MQIIIIDYNMGNVGSIANMIKKVGGKSHIASTIETIEQAEKLILPGVGAFDAGMRQLEDRGFLPALNKKVLEQKIPILGICLGMQLMTQCSEEGQKPGLGWIPSETKRFDFSDISQRLRIPHMGWNTVSEKKKHLFTANLDEQSRFYFVHSYYVQCHQKEDVLLQTEYGWPFTSAFQHENIFGVQFHPEKSHKFGMQLFRNFLAL